MKVLWECSNCHLKISLETEDFPVHCKCGKLGVLEEASEFNENELPSIIRMAKNFAKATVKDVVSGFERLEEEEYQKRLAICNTCSYVIKYEGRVYRCSHKDCGCFLSKKARRKSEDCPMGYWPKE